MLSHKQWYATPRLIFNKSGFIPFPFKSNLLSSPANSHGTTGFFNGTLLPSSVKLNYYLSILKVMKNRYPTTLQISSETLLESVLELAMSKKKSYQTIVIGPFLYLKPCLKSKWPGTMDKTREDCMSNVFFHQPLLFISNNCLKAIQGAHVISLKRIIGFVVYLCAFQTISPIYPA